MMTTAGVVTMGGVATTVAGTVAGDILAGVITMGGGILAGGTVGGTTNPRVLTFARVCQRSDVSFVPLFFGILPWSGTTATCVYRKPYPDL
jgi:hypothetical protein